MIQRLWENVFGMNSADAPAETAWPASTLVLSVPVPLRGALLPRAPGVFSTADVFAKLLAEAKEGVKIFSPYVDPTFTNLAQAARVPIQVVTTLREGRSRSSPVLERFATNRPLAVRYLHEKQASAQMFQLHAKMILADRTRAYVGSANFTDTSLHYNFELGMTFEDRGLIDTLHAIFDYVFDFAARPAAAR